MAVPLFVVHDQRRIVPKRSKLLEQLTDYEVRRHTGFSTRGVRDIIDIFEPLSGQTSAAISVETKVLCYLSHLRSGSFQWCLGSLSGVAQSTVSRILVESLNFTLSLTPSVIKFPQSLEEMNSVKQSFAEIAGFQTLSDVLTEHKLPLKLRPKTKESLFAESSFTP